MAGLRAGYKVPRFLLKVLGLSVDNEGMSTTYHSMRLAGLAALACVSGLILSTLIVWSL